MTTPQYAPFVYVQRPPSNGLAVASLVLGIVAILIAPWALIPILGLVAVVLAIVPVALALAFGHSGRRRARQLGGTGSGLATAGLVMGYLSALLCAMSVIFFIAALAVGGSTQ